MNAVLEHILRHDPDDTTLLEALAILYSHEKKYDRALAMYLKYARSLKFPYVFFKYLIWFIGFNMLTFFDWYLSITSLAPFMIRSWH